MPPIIRLPDELYTRLSKHAQGFDTPANVIEKLLNQVEGISPAKEAKEATNLNSKRPELVFFPDEASFRQGLIDGHTGEVTLHLSNGCTVRKEWRSVRFTERSNLRGNIWSGLLRDWQQQGITAAEFSMLVSDGK